MDDHTRALGDKDPARPKVDRDLARRINERFEEAEKKKERIAREKEQEREKLRKRREGIILDISPENYEFDPETDIREVAGSIYDFDSKKFGFFGGELMSPRDEAYLRLITHSSKRRVFGNRGNWTSAGIVYSKAREPILRIPSPLHSLAAAGIAARVEYLNAEKEKQSVYYDSSDREYEKCLKEAQSDASKEPKDRNVMVLPRDDDHPHYLVLSPSSNPEVFEAIFRDMAGPYFELIGKHVKLPLLSRDVIEEHDGTIFEQLRLKSFGHDSNFIGSSDGHSYEGAYYVLGPGAKDKKVGGTNP